MPNFLDYAALLLCMLTYICSYNYLAIVLLYALNHFINYVDKIYDDLDKSLQKQEYVTIATLR